ncbi:pyridoxal phosphatase [Pasteurella canis]|uniref:pyridoxal phosphatase n=1 Tax=Pasteurella canis TaxID=753 RepID=UPI001CBB17E0|nr:pyridoxal phosphatase [Pasteurella canis]UAX41978.1 pyridoxal phosphatase [Pasteurella canis]
MKYQVIAFDLDGTLLNSQGQILTSSKIAIQRCIDKGLKVILVTGRHHTAAYPYYHELNLTTPMICCNGTYVYQPQTDAVLTANPLSLEQARQVIQLADKHHLHLLMYSRDAMNYSVMNAHMRKFSEWVQSCPPHVRPKLRQVSDFNSLLNKQETIWKFVISHPDRALMQMAVDHLSPAGFSCEWSWIDRVDIANGGNTKGARLLELLRSWQIDPQFVVAFGDNHNDISMLNSVGLGVAMGNAETEVKQQAHLVTLSHDEAGIASVLDSIFD